MNDGARKFRKKYEVYESEEKSKRVFDPDVAAKQIEIEQIKEFAELVRGTPNEDFVAFKDAKVQELVDYIMAAIIIENERVNAPDAFPLQIYRRYKSDNSLKTKMEEWSGRKEKEGEQVTDYLGFKIIPEAEHAVFYSGGDETLQKLIEKSEEIRTFIAETYQDLSSKTELTFEEYMKKTTEVLKHLQRCFPKEASERRKYYVEKEKQIKRDFDEYAQMVEDSNTPLPIQDIYEITDVSIKSLLRELSQNYSNDVTLYKLQSDLMNTFTNSELLKMLGISVSDSPDRTKSKSTKNGYRSEFIGLDLTLFLDNNKTIELPIECQVQTSEQYRDGNIGFSAHTKLPTKSIKLKSIPKIGNGERYTDPTGDLEECTKFLSHVMHISPSCAIAKTTGNDFETGRVIITPYDLYEAFRLISRVPADSLMYRTYEKYLGELYAKREDLFPAGDTLLPKYIRFDDIPNNQGPNNGKAYYSFFNDLSVSVSNTMEDALGDSEKTQLTMESDSIDSEEKNDTVNAKDSKDEMEL